jgi:hypothetical protein
MTDSEKKNAEKIMNDAIRALNMSATSVYHLSNLQGESYRDCLNIITKYDNMTVEFTEFYGITADNAITLLDNKVLNESILDVILQNSKPKTVDFLF